MYNHMPDKVFSGNSWYKVKNTDEVFTPSLLVYPDRIEQNIKRMIVIAGGPDRILPHVKTHKMSEIIRLQLKYGIDKFKCATVAEAEMVAGCGAKEILLAIQPVGPNIDRFFRLIREFKATRFSCIVDCVEIIHMLSEASVKKDLPVHVWLDINNGMNRTGVAPGKNAEALFELICGLPGLIAEGLHVYDGHIHEHDYSKREKICNEAFESVEILEKKLSSKTGSPLRIVAGGTPTFPIHAKRQGVVTSPGTTLLWDYGYSRSYKDLDFLNAALLLTRVISKPSGDMICIDLGHKALGSEMPQPRVWIADLDDYDIVSHNEEHMVIRTSKARELKPGDTLYGIPVHICPTVDRFDVVSVVREGKVSEEWKVDARRRVITI